MRNGIILIFTSLVYACGSIPLQMAEEVYSPELVRDMELGVFMEAEQDHFDTAPERIRIRIKNGTKETISFGAGYVIERYDEYNEHWVNYGPPAETAVIAIQYMLEPGKSNVYDIALFPDRISYTPGSYRVVKKISEEGEIKEYYAPFVLND